MAMSKGFRVLEKSKPPAPHSVLLEHRNQSEALLFESQAVAVLCEFRALECGYIVGFFVFYMKGYSLMIRRT